MADITLKQALRRIETLEAKVAELEAKPAVVHHHYHYAQPLGVGGAVPSPTVLPFRPYTTCMASATRQGVL